MPFDLSEAAPNFHKAIDIILKPVIGRFVLVYMDDVIITSPSFNEHLDNLNQVFTLLRDAGLTLNKDKCHFARDKLKYLGLVISKEGIETDHSKVKAITEIKPRKNSKEVSNFLWMARRGAEEQRNREYSTEQHQEKEPQYGRFRRRSSGLERIKGKENIRKDLLDELKIFGMFSRHHIDDFMRGRNIEKIEVGRKKTDVARESDITHSIVSRLWKSFKTTGMCSRRHRGGRVRSTTPAEERYIVISAKRNRRTTAQQVANQFLAASGKQISRKTCCQTFEERRSIRTQTRCVCPIDQTAPYYPFAMVS
ncbi:retrovirus-related Pol polyprotein from transposon 297 [Trichonephila clavipes]|nr:retrovirus-related Pol polyprotein from transposon 297 [Trichonephila clavipes]